MWPFFLTYTKTYTKAVPDVSEDDILRVLHDPPILIKLNPLVTKCEVLDPSRPGLYTIYDDLMVLKVFKTPIVYSANFTQTSDGTDTEVKAGAWTTLRNKWRARSTDSGEIEISETVTIRCIFLFLPFIIRTLDSEHSILLERFAKKVIEGKARETDERSSRKSSLRKVVHGTS